MGCWAFFFNFKGTPSWILPKAFCRLKPKILKFYAKIEGAENHMQHLLLFYNISTNLNGATESLAPYKWCYKIQK
jgi:hypothetical protein